MVLFLNLSIAAPHVVVASLVPFARKMAKRNRHSVDEVSKFECASSTSVPEGKRAFALAAVRNQRSSLLIPAQEKTQSDVKGQENPRQTSGVRLHFPGTTGNPDT